MTKATNTTLAPETGANATDVKKTEAVKAPVKRVTMEDAIRSNIRKGKTFDLVRSYYTSKRNNKNYYSFSVFLIICNGTGFEEVRLVPNTGFLAVRTEKDKNVMTNRNATSYRMLNWLYDNGNGAKLECLERKDSEGRAIGFDFQAVVCDENGIEVKVLLKPATPGDEDFLRAGFAGYGNCRDYLPEDFGKVKGLHEAFNKMLLPGEVPSVEVEQDYE